MIKSKKINILIFSFLLIMASFLFVACGVKNYNDVKLVSDKAEISLFVGESTTVKFSIKNPVKNMDKKLEPLKLSKPICEVKLLSKKGYDFTYEITGVSGGSAILDATTSEGFQTTSVKINVKQYADSINPSDNKLYVSTNRTMVPSSADFVFDEKVTEKDLEFYLYGKPFAKNSLTVDDVQKDLEFINRFVEVKYFELSEKKYLIFTDHEGNHFTLSKEIQLEEKGEKFLFLPVELKDTTYVFDAEQAYDVKLGESFGFIAYYRSPIVQLSEDKKEIFCERDFFILSDINYESVEHEYGYKIERSKLEDDPSDRYVIADHSTGDITLVPGYSMTIMDNPILVGETASFKTVYLSVKIATDSELIQVDSWTGKQNGESENDIASSKRINKMVEEGFTTFNFAINCHSTIATKTYFNIRFCYEGFENSEDKNVNFLYSIPLDIRIIPKTVHVNHVDLTKENKIFTFYNNYSNANVGWQSFNFDILPTGGEYTSLVIDLTGSGILLKYKNHEFSNEEVVIDDLSLPVFMKGINNTEITAEPQLLPMKLIFNVIKQSEIKWNMKYEIIQGTTELKYTTPKFKDGIFIDLNNKDGVEFLDIVSDAKFNDFKIEKTVGLDNVEFIIDKDNIYKFNDNGSYSLRMKIKGLIYGTSTYKVTTDNGTSIALTISTEESLQNVTVKSKNTTDIIKKFEQTVDEYGNEKASLYVYNYGEDKSKYNDHFDLEVIANDNPDSKAIRNTKPEKAVGNQKDYDIGDAENDNKNFNVYIKKNGIYGLNIVITGNVINNFVSKELIINYSVEITVFNFIESLNIKKERDGFENYVETTGSAVDAPYVDIYSNTRDEQKRQAKLDILVKNTEALLFADPSSLPQAEFRAEKFNQNFVYWDTSVASSSEDNIMYIGKKPNDPNYQIKDYGIFNVETLTFTARDTSDRENDIKFKLNAHVRQFGFLYTYTINITIHKYIDVLGITKQSSGDSLEFSALKNKQDVIAYPINNDSTEKELTVLVTGCEIRVGGEQSQVYKMFEEGDIKTVIADGKTQFIFTVNQNFIKNAVNYKDKISGRILIVSSDWLDNSNQILPRYRNKTYPKIDISYANGEENNRYTISSADDFAMIKNNLSSHYQIKNSVDISTVSNILPLGEFSGSIIGLKKYSAITGININSSDFIEGDKKIYGIFTKVAKSAYIKNVSFEGLFNIDDTVNNGEDINKYVTVAGLIAGYNYGRFENVGAILNESNLKIHTGYIGGMVGVNSGEIIQDFTVFDSDSTTNIDVNSFSPKMLVNMKGLMTVNYENKFGSLDKSYKVCVGGAVGLNGTIISENNQQALAQTPESVAVIRRIDSRNLVLMGYSKYTAYSNIKAIPSDSSVTENNTLYLGGLVGVMDNNAELTAGYLEHGEYKKYSQFVSSLTNIGDFKAGDGILVGGEVSGFDYVGGVVGAVPFISVDNLTGITSRTFVRVDFKGDNPGLANSSAGAIACENPTLYDDVVSLKANPVSATTAFAVQAIDDGKVGVNASMMIVYGKKKYTKPLNANMVVFGVYTTCKNMYGLNGEESYYKNLNSFVDREFKNEISNNLVSKKNYFGDFLMLGKSNGKDVILDQKIFEKGKEEHLSLNAKFNNEMTRERNIQSISGKKIFYMFYFDFIDKDLSEEINSENDPRFFINKVDPTSILYPFDVSGEMTFVSTTPDVLVIDQNGTIHVKKTGLAHVVANSILNSTNALDFYIYVTNYFNPDIVQFDDSLEIGQDDLVKKSIIYPNGSESSLPIDNTEILLSGNHSIALVVKPHYTLNIMHSGERYVSDAYGNLIFKNKYFKLKENSDVSAEITKINNQNVDEIALADMKLSINVTGQIINITKTDKTTEGVYNIEITPRLSYIFNEGNEKDKYYVDVNKIITDTKITYKYGAKSINTINYNEVPMISSNEINETISIDSDTTEDAPSYQLYFYSADSNQRYLIQTSSSTNNFFNIEISKIIDQDSEGVIVEDLHNQRFSLIISVNKNSDRYQNRYKKDIYGRYELKLITGTNSDVYTTLYINFEKTNINSIVVDNYTNIKESTGESGISQQSNMAFPGYTGLLSITINPDDTDFDYITIENDASNYDNGHAHATFGFVSRKQNVHNGDILFDDATIVGSSIKDGIKLKLQDIVKHYSKEEDGEALYYNYNGIIYVKYDMASQNVMDKSTSTFVISVYKDDNLQYQVRKNLKIKLQNYVAVELVGKESIAQQGQEYYASYVVARGKEYKLNVKSYGFDVENIVITSSNDALGTIIKKNGGYYLKITSSNINYLNLENVLDIQVSASKQSGDVVRVASSKTKITIQEFVLNYNGENVSGKEDIIRGMGQGIISLQVGTKTNFAVDLYDYIEYDKDNVEVVNKIAIFMQQLANVGNWEVITNLVSDVMPGQGKAEKKVGFMQYMLAPGNSGVNYYFKYKDLSIMPTKTHSAADQFYYVNFNVKFEVNNGVYVARTKGVDDNNFVSNVIHTQFFLDVYSLSSEESPIPIYDYDDFLAMQRGGYYILLNDILLPNKPNEKTNQEAYVPQEAKFKSFDGNGHTIMMAGEYDVGNAEKIGIFTTLPLRSIIKNLNVKFAEANDGSDLNTENVDDAYDLYGLKTVKFNTTAETFTFGSLVADNLGIITNCSVESINANNSEYYLSVIADNANKGCVIGGLAGNNSGYITNCKVSINIKSPFKIGGLVGNNSGKIAASTFKNGKIINNSNMNQYAAGFAYANKSNGQIITSYVAGKPSNNILFTQDKNSYISSNERGAGFIYENYGKISDCYTDIYLAMTPNMAGFVYENGGSIKNSFSMSTLINDNASAAGFVYNVVKKQSDDGTNSAKAVDQEGKTPTEMGQQSNCYYFYNEDNDYITASGSLSGFGNINTALQEKDFQGVKKLNAEGFADLSNFEDYSYQTTTNFNSIWFLSNKGNVSNDFVEYIPSTEKIQIKGDNENGTQINTVYKTEIMTFASGRLELVSPNTSALSMRNFSYSEEDAETGNIIYHYIDDENIPSRGSIHNPHIITDYVSMEREILLRNSKSNMNIDNYRIVSDVDYIEAEGSKLYLTTFAGVLEGNGMKISSIILNSNETLNSAGLFAQVGYSSSKTGTIKNLYVSPKNITFSNVNNVGTVAGIVSYGYLYDIHVDFEKTADEIKPVYGKNFVGGVVGKAVSSFIMKDIYSNMNATAYIISTASFVYDEDEVNDALYSYAGGIAGYVGRGEVSNVHCDSITSIMGSRAGIVFGGIGKGANVDYAFANVDNGQYKSKIKAYYYGGMIAGEVRGILKHAYVTGSSELISPFSIVPAPSVAVGGVAGILAGGTISNAVVDQPFRVTSSTNSGVTIQNVGGIVGIIDKSPSYISNIKHVIISGDVVANTLLGGVVGLVKNHVVLNDIAIKSNKLSVIGQKINPILGGAIGKVQVKASIVKVLNTYCTSNLTINTITSGIASTANIGGLVGMSNVQPDMLCCYTTSMLDVSLTDMRSLGELQDYSTLSGMNNIKSMFEYRQTKLARTSSVYYYGTDQTAVMSSSSASADDSNQNLYKNRYKNFVKFSVKCQPSNAQQKVCYNNYGESSMAYEAQFGGTVSSAGTDLKLFNNMFGEYLTYQGETLFYNHFDNSFFSRGLKYSYNGNTGTYQNISEPEKALNDTVKFTGENEGVSPNKAIMAYYMDTDGRKYYYLPRKGDDIYSYHNGYKYDNQTGTYYGEGETIQITDSVDGELNKKWMDYKLVREITVYKNNNSLIHKGLEYTYNINTGKYKNVARPISKTVGTTKYVEFDAPNKNITPTSDVMAYYLHSSGQKYYCISGKYYSKYNYNAETETFTGVGAEAVITNTVGGTGIEWKDIVLVRELVLVTTNSVIQSQIFTDEDGNQYKYSYEVVHETITSENIDNYKNKKATIDNRCYYVKNNGTKYYYLSDNKFYTSYEIIEGVMVGTGQEETGLSFIGLKLVEISNTPVYTDLNTMETYVYDSGLNMLVSRTNASNKRKIPTYKVWISSLDSNTHLVIEDDLDWLYKV